MMKTIIVISFVAIAVVMVQAGQDLWHRQRSNNVMIEQEETEPEDDQCREFFDKIKESIAEFRKEHPVNHKKLINFLARVHKMRQGEAQQESENKPRDRLSRLYDLGKSKFPKLFEGISLDDFKECIVDALEKEKEIMEKIRERIEEKKDEIKEKIRERVGEKKDEIKEKIRERIGEKKDEIKEKIRERIGEKKDEIKEKIRERIEEKTDETEG